MTRQETTAEATARDRLLELDAAKARIAVLEAQIAVLRPTNPPPQGGHGDVWADIIAYMPDDHPMRAACIARRAFGLAKYGQPLRYDDGRDNNVDLREELLDASAYAWKMDRGRLCGILLEVAADPARWVGMQNGLEIQAGHLKTVEGELRRRLGKPEGHVFLETELIDAIDEIARGNDLAQLVRAQTAAITQLSGRLEALAIIATASFDEDAANMLVAAMKETP